MTASSHAADATGAIDAPAETVFEFLDDQSNLSSHMSESSWMMLGSQFPYRDPLARATPRAPHVPGTTRASTRT
jgi:hypothetical protein